MVGPQQRAISNEQLLNTPIIELIQMNALTHAIAAYDIHVADVRRENDEYTASKLNQTKGA